MKVDSSLLYFLFLLQNRVYIFDLSAATLSPFKRAIRRSMWSIPIRMDGTLSSSIQFHKCLLLIAEVRARAVMVRFPVFCAALAQ